MGSSHSFDIHRDNMFAAMGGLKKNVIIERKDEFPERLKQAIEEASLNSSRNPNIFLTRIQETFADWLFEAALSNNEDSRCGLDDERDTEQQVELALRFFPRVLCQRRYGLFPIFWLTKSTRSVSFIPLFARLGTELGLFQESERGGLVFGTNGMDVFSQLAATATTGGESNGEGPPNQEIVDAKFLAVIQKLRETKLMRRSDIEKYKMIDILRQQSVFPKQRFLYLVDWCPSALLSNHGRGKVQTISVGLIMRFFDKDDISGIKMLFELSMKYYPAELGFLFDTIYTVDDEKDPSSFRKKPRTLNTTTINNRYNRRNRRRIIVEEDNSEIAGAASEDNNNLPHTKLDKNSITSLFEFACDTYGAKEVQHIVDRLLFGQMTKDTNFTRNAVVRAAASCRTSVNGAESIFLLMQKDPTLLQLNPSLTVRSKPSVPRSRPKFIAARTA